MFSFENNSHTATQSGHKKFSIWVINSNKLKLFIEAFNKQEYIITKYRRIIM